MTRTHQFAIASRRSVLLAASVSAENWPQWRGPGGQGISAEKQLPTEWAPGQEHRVEDGTSQRALVADCVGRSLFVTAAIEGEVVPGAKAVAHTQGGQPFVHPDSVAADKKHTLKVIALDAKTGKQVWDAGRIRRHRLRCAPPPQQLRGSDGGDRRTDGVCLLRSRGSLRVRLQAASLRGRSIEKFADAGPRHRHLARALPEPRHHPARRRQRRQFRRGRLRQEIGQGSLEDQARHRDQLGHAGPGAGRRPHGARDQRQLRDRGVRPGDGQGTVAHEGRATATPFTRRSSARGS